MIQAAVDVSNIKPGDDIEYIANFVQHGRIIDHVAKRKGKVKQVTGRVITIQGQRYPETILINDLITGKAKLIKLVKGEDDVGKQVAEMPSIEEIKLFCQHQGMGNIIRKLRTHYHIAHKTALDWLKKAGVEYPVKKQAQDQNQEPTTTKEPETDLSQPAENSITPAADDSQGKDPEAQTDINKEDAAFAEEFDAVKAKQEIQSTQYSPEDNVWQPKDDEPIPFMIADAPESPGCSGSSWSLDEYIDLKLMSIGTQLKTTLRNPVNREILRDMFREGVI